MIERVKFYCPYCGAEYCRSFSVPDPEETKNYVCGIAVLTETFVR